MLSPFMFSSSAIFKTVNWRPFFTCYKCWSVEVLDRWICNLYCLPFLLKLPYPHAYMHAQKKVLNLFCCLNSLLTILRCQWRVSPISLKMQKCNANILQPQNKLNSNYKTAHYALMWTNICQLSDAVSCSTKTSNLASQEHALCVTSWWSQVTNAG